MKILIKLIKIYLRTIFDVNKVLNIHNKKEFQKTSSIILLYIFAFGYLAYYIYYGASFTLKGLTEMGIEHIILVAIMTLSSIYLIFKTIIKVNKTLFNAKDYSFLLSLPIKKSTIIASKIFILYFANLIFLSFFMIPTYIAYIIGVGPSLYFHFNFFVSLIFIPLIPTVIGGIIGGIFTAIMSRFKYKNLANILINLGFIFVIYYFSFKSQNMNAIDLAMLSESLVNKLNSIYPLAKIYSEIIQNNGIIHLFLFIGISLGIFELFKYIVEKYFDIINSKLNDVTINNVYKDKLIKSSSPLKSLYKKELKRYVSSSLYVLNTAIGCILLIVSIILLFIVGGERLDAILNIPDFSKIFMTKGPLMFGVFASLSCTTHSSISLEGKNLWILKSLPVNITQIFFAKIMINLTIIIPTILISSIALTIGMHLSFLNFLVLLFTPIVYAIFISGLGLLINLFFPIFDWVNEIKVIKQSMASFLTLMLGMAISIIPITISVKINATLYSFIVGLVMLIACLILYTVLFNKGKKLFKSL